MTGAGLGRGDVGVGHQMDVGPGDAAGVGGQDDRTVHLGQLGQPLRAERRIEQEAARTDVEHVRAVADDDQGALLGLKDAVECLTQWRAGATAARALSREALCEEPRTMLPDPGAPRPESLVDGVGDRRGPESRSDDRPGSTVAGTIAVR